MHSLLLKERIKLRYIVWLLPLLLFYATVDSFLILKAVHRAHGSFGLVFTLLTREPLFFRSFRVLLVAGVLLAFMQVWPEVRGKRLRLLFHTPLPPEKLVGTTLLCGMIIMLTANLVAHMLLAGTMFFFHIPTDIIGPVLLTLLPWSLLSLIVYLGCAALLYNDSMVFRGFVLLACIAMHGLMAPFAGYGLQAHASGLYAVFVLFFSALAFFACLRLSSAPDQRLIYRLARAISLTLIILSLCSLLPDLYWRFATPRQVRHKLFYSPVHEQFVVVKQFPDKVIGPSGTGHSRIELEDGTPLSRRQMVYALPILHADSLLKWNAFPDNIQGIHLTPEQARNSWRYLTLHPHDWNAPEPRLHLLLESEPEGARLELPSDFFRLSAARSALEFINPRTGCVDRGKSTHFTAALRGAGFSFPVRALAGNPDPRKDYDEGYLLLDGQNRLFQLKMARGAPVCRAGGVLPTGVVRGMILMEHRSSELLGLIITAAKVFGVMQKDLSLHAIPISGFDADRTRFSLWADLLGKCVVSGDVTDPCGGSLGQAMTPDFSIRREYYQPREASDILSMRRREQVAAVLFPLRLVQQDITRTFAHLRLEPTRFAGLGTIGNLLCVLLLMVLRYWKRVSLRWWEYALVGIFGLVALVVLWLEKFPVTPKLRRFGM